jgi:hypothetical protein
VAQFNSHVGLVDWRFVCGIGDQNNIQQGDDGPIVGRGLVDKFATFSEICKSKTIFLV